MAPAKLSHHTGDVDTDSTQNHIKKSQKSQGSEPAQELRDAGTQSQLDVEPDDGQTESQEGSTIHGEESSDEVEAAGSVDAEGNVLDDDGNIIGTVEGEIPEGSLVDTEGDVLDDEGNVIGTAKSIEGLETKGEEVASKADVGTEEAVGDASGRAEGDIGEGVSYLQLKLTS